MSDSGRRRFGATAVLLVIVASCLTTGPAAAALGDSPSETTTPEPTATVTSSPTVTPVPSDSPTSSSPSTPTSPSSTPTAQPPVIQALSPSAASTVGGTTVTVTGANFTLSTTVRFGDVDATGVTVRSSTELTAVAPAHDAGVAQVVVTTPAGSSSTGPAGTFTYTPPRPVGDAAPTPVYRWWQAGDRDWLTVPTHGSAPTSATLLRYRYIQHPQPQYWVAMVASPRSDLVAVHRWWHPADRDWSDVAEGSIPDTTLTRYGYTSKVFQFYLHRSPGSGRVGVYRWWNAADRDWITVRDGEISDATMARYRYTGKALVGYANPTAGTVRGYFALDPADAAVVRASEALDTFPHTMSVVDVNPSRDPDVNKGHRYLGFYGHNDCAGIRLARTDDLDSPRWEQDDAKVRFPGGDPCRWASALVDGDRVALVVNDVWDTTITAQTSVDGLDATSFGPATVIVGETNARNGNPTLFRDPDTGRWHLFWFRRAGADYEIRMKDADTFAGLIGTGRDDIGVLVARSPERIAAPQVMKVRDRYYLAIETYERSTWFTRVLTSASAEGPYYEVAGNPLYGPGDACVIQHVWGDVMHAFLCRQGVPGDDRSWTLDHVRADLRPANQD